MNQSLHLADRRRTPVSVENRGLHGTAAPRTAAMAQKLVRLVLRAIRWPSRVAAIRRDMRLLGGMDDRALSDIGLVRQDLQDTAALPLDVHPGDFLGRRVQERRQGSVEGQAARPRGRRSL